MIELITPLATIPTPEHIAAGGVSPWLFDYPMAVERIGVVCIVISGWLMLQMWVNHRRAPFFKKLVWSCILAIPLFGWMLHAGLFQIPDYTDIPLAPTHDSIGGNVG